MHRVYQGAPPTTITTVRDPGESVMSVYLAVGASQAHNHPNRGESKDDRPHT